MAIGANAEYREAFTAFADFLGFSEASRELSDERRLKVLELLRSLAGLRSEFSAASEKGADGSTRFFIRPAISTFSDHIVISFDLETLHNTLGNDAAGATTPLLYLHQFERLASIIAAQALRLGFLIRGGATIGKLYHAEGVVFGEALVEVTQLEAQTAVYPRIVLSSAAASSLAVSALLKQEDDGVYCVDYLRSMMFNAAQPGDEWAANVKKWFEEVVAVIGAALDTHSRSGALNKFAKWTWFAKRFRETVEGLPEPAIKALGISVEAIPSQKQQK